MLATLMITVYIPVHVVTLHVACIPGDQIKLDIRYLTKRCYIAKCSGGGVS
jgi:hypothetical protein